MPKTRDGFMRRGFFFAWTRDARPDREITEKVPRRCQSKYAVARPFHMQHRLRPKENQTAPRSIRRQE